MVGHEFLPVGVLRKSHQTPFPPTKRGSPHPSPFIPLWSWSFSASGDPADTDYTAVGCAITTISSNLTEMSKGVKLLAALMDDDVGSGEDLLRAARTLAGAVSDLLKAVQPTSGEVSPKDP